MVNIFSQMLEECKNMYSANISIFTIVEIRESHFQYKLNPVLNYKLYMFLIRVESFLLFERWD